MRQPLDKNEILLHLGDLANKFDISFYPLTDSTNRRARELAAAGPIDKPAVLLAQEQTAGRGRLGRSFLSERGGLYISFLYFPRGCAGETVGITAEAAVKLSRAIDSSCGIQTGIKWVNDIYLNGKKIAGILTEGEFDESGKLRYYIVGMGINVYKIEDFSSKIPIATTLEDEIKFAPDINKLCAEIIKEMLSDEEGDTLLEYRERSVTLGERVTVMAADPYEARAIEILDDYSLLVEQEDGTRISVNSGEVSTSILKR